MAVDTRDKRSSAIFPAIPWRNRYPDPDGTIDADDRTHADLHYEGIAISAPSTVVVASDSIIPEWYMIKRHSFTRGANRGGRFSR